MRRSFLTLCLFQCVFGLIAPHGRAQTVSPCGFSGATADGKINAALATIPNGGTVDATCWGSTTQTIAATVTLSAFQTLQFDPATTLKPSSASVNMFVISNNSHLSGLHVVFPASMTYTAAVVSTTGAFTGNTTVSNFNIDASQESGSGATSGYGILLVSTAIPTNYVYGVDVGPGYCWGLGSCVALVAHGTGYVNGNNIHGIVVDSSGYCLNLGADGSGTTPAVGGNTIWGVQCEAAATGGIAFTGNNAAIQNNIIGPFKIWDTSTPIVNNLNIATRNWLWGSIDGAYSDPNAALSKYPNQNVYCISGSAGTFNGCTPTNFISRPHPRSSTASMR